MFLKYNFFSCFPVKDSTNITYAGHSVGTCNSIVAMVIDYGVITFIIREGHSMQI